MQPHSLTSFSENIWVITLYVYVHCNLCIHTFVHISSTAWNYGHQMSIRPTVDKQIGVRPGRSWNVCGVVTGIGCDWKGLWQIAKCSQLNVHSFYLCKHILRPHAHTNQTFIYLITFFKLHTFILEAPQKKERELGAKHFAEKLISSRHGLTKSITINEHSLTLYSLMKNYTMEFTVYNPSHSPLL